MNNPPRHDVNPDLAEANEAPVLACSFENDQQASS
jgi:hypothetical protein